MKFNCARCASLAILLAALTTHGWCQDTGLSRNIPLPPLPPIGNGYPIRQTAVNDAVWGQQELSPVQTGPVQSPTQGPLQPEIIQGPVQGPIQGPIQVPKDSLITPDYAGAMNGNYSGCDSVGSPCGGYNCCHNHYVYANALLMTQSRQGGFVTSIDSVTQDQRINFCSQNLNNLWNGGFEVGGGWCFGGCCGGCGSCAPNAVEFIYWGVFPASRTITAVNNLTSTIDFSDLTYNGASANVPFTASQLQQTTYTWNFNSVEANLVGSSWNGGPFGCLGRCGCCNGNGGSPWGFGWVAGFRYINFSEGFLFSGDPNDTVLNGDPAELNYAVALTNNLFGFQIGGGLSYCVTSRLQAYVIGKFGIYDNHVTQLQKVYGTAGIATVNNGIYTGNTFDVHSTRDAFATAGQFDLGGRWTITNNWSANFGYRVLGLAGVATVDGNVRHGQFHDLDGVGVMSRNGNFILHGAFAGLTYCW
jgi:hypothetical protein